MVSGTSYTPAGNASVAVRWLAESVMDGVAAVPVTVQFAASQAVAAVTFWLKVKSTVNEPSAAFAIAVCTTARSFSVAKLVGSGTMLVTALTQAFAIFV